MTPDSTLPLARDEQAYVRALPRLSQRIKAIGWAVCLATLLGAWIFGTTLNAGVLSFQALMVVLVTTAGGMHGRFGGLSLAGACAGGMLLVGWRQFPLAGPGWGALALTLLIHAAALAAAVGLGRVLCRLLSRQLDLAAEREARFRGLLRLAADWYWELDAELRFTRVDEGTPGASGVAAAARIGRHPWELPSGLSEAELQAHRADLEARRPFRDLIAPRRGADGRTRHVAISGEPRYDARGTFIGYWGMGRDITEAVEARHAAAAGETRYHELFTSTPTPMLLERDGQLLDANAAALALFGYADLAAMRAGSLIEHFSAGDGSRQRMREWSVRLDRLEAGRSLAPEAHTLISADGRRYLVLATGVRVNAAGGPANLTIYTDETERRRAEDAMQRSEALLAHLVATSPDAIALIEAGSDRYTMVNQTFGDIFGYANDEVIGRTSVELGLWQDRAQVDQFRLSLQLSDRVEAMPALLRNRSGALMAMLVSASSFTLDGTEYLVFNARDVSQLESARGVYEAILQNASVGIGFTRRHLVVQANARLGEIFGWPDGSLIGQPARALWSSEADYNDYLATIRPRLAQGERVEFQRSLRRRDGTEVWCRIQGQTIASPHADLGGTVWIVEDISEQRSVAQALARAYEAAETASRAKSAFLANTSHELRTPLNALLGLARLAQDEGVGAERRRRYIDQIADSAQTLADIINDILDLSKIEAGKLEIENVPFDLHDKLASLHRAFASLAEARKLTLELDIDAAVPRHVLGDPTRTRQIVSNFVANALKFTTRGGVVIRARRLGGKVRLEVADSGPGIDAAVRARLFTPFTQADQSTTRRFGGTGLGLSICRELAGLMGGAVGVDSEVGRGSVFWCELPMPQDDHESIVTQYSTFHGHDPLYGSNLLVVEDNPVNMMICVALLEQHGVRVTQADNGQAALDAVEQAARDGTQFDAVLMDMQMPVMGGLDATRALRCHYSASELPIIALTAAALVSEREQAIEAGMNAFLTKPIDPRRLVRALSRVLAGDALSRS